MLMDLFLPAPGPPLPLERVRTRAFTAVSTPRPLQNSRSVLQNFSGCRQTYRRRSVNTRRGAGRRHQINTTPARLREENERGSHNTSLIIKSPLISQLADQDITTAVTCHRSPRFTGHRSPITHRLDEHVSHVVQLDQRRLGLVHVGVHGVHGVVVGGLGAGHQQGVHLQVRHR